MTTVCFAEKRIVQRLAETIQIAKNKKICKYIKLEIKHKN